MTHRPEHIGGTNIAKWEAMFNPDLLRREPIVYRTAHKRWMMLAPYISAAFWATTLALFLVIIYLSPARVLLP